MSAERTVWGTLPFNPRIELEPAPVSFDKFISWSPEAKFESDGDRLIIGSDIGSRNMLAMLLMTFGLGEAAKLPAPARWQRAVELRLLEIADADKLREKMLERVCKAAQIIKEIIETRCCAKLCGTKLSAKQSANYLIF